mgnify:CR=1 FL=1
MIVELGHFALILALAVAVIQSIVPLIGAERRNAAWMAVAEPAAVTQFLLIAFSFAALRKYESMTLAFGIRGVLGGKTPKGQPSVLGCGAAVRCGSSRKKPSFSHGWPTEPLCMGKNFPCK